MMADTTPCCLCRWYQLSDQFSALNVLPGGSMYGYPSTCVSPPPFRRLMRCGAGILLLRRGSARRPPAVPCPVRGGAARAMAMQINRARIAGNVDPTAATDPPVAIAT